MQIRSITLFCEPDYPLAAAEAFFATAKAKVDLNVQTCRTALTPFPRWWDRDRDPFRQAQDIALNWAEAGADYLSLGPVQLRDDAEMLQLLPAILGVHGSIFASAEIADTSGNIASARAMAIADVILAASEKEHNGFGNLYFAALAYCRPGSPFFPVAYHGGGPARFAFAVEAADLAVDSFREANSLRQARQNLVSAIETEAARLREFGHAIADANDIEFAGIDFSLAPYPEHRRSIGAAVEALGVGAVGGGGSLFATAVIADAINRARFPRCGFSGVMLPVLEDAVLAQRAAEGTLRIGDLLLYAAVCGVGLDTIPLPGDVTRSQLTAILLDVAALGARLHKPLTARLMPMPGLVAGDPVVFDFPYFAPSRVMAIEGAGVTGLLASPDELALLPIPAAAGNL